MGRVYAGISRAPVPECSGLGPCSNAQVSGSFVCNKCTIFRGCFAYITPQGSIIDVLLDEPDRGARAAMLPEAFTPPPPSPQPKVRRTSVSELKKESGRASTVSVPYTLYIYIRYTFILYLICPDSPRTTWVCQPNPPRR